MTRSGRCFAIVPAAGKSRRMGQPKLMLPFAEGLLIDRLLKAWTDSEVFRVIVVVRQNDRNLSEACHRWPVDVVHPGTDPTDMKESIQVGAK
ncbi:MAG: NTP transferase domain-containing protein, partial [Fuerstiella sp.]|nr:NTP transferase domain-containing protein [Fuerstiella sp.]